MPSDPSPGPAANPLDDLIRELLGWSSHFRGPDMPPTAEADYRRRFLAAVRDLRGLPDFNELHVIAAQSYAENSVMAEAFETQDLRSIFATESFRALDQIYEASA